MISSSARLHLWFGQVFNWRDNFSAPTQILNFVRDKNRIANFVGDEYLYQLGLWSLSIIKPLRTTNTFDDRNEYLMESWESVVFHCGEDVIIGNRESACTSNLTPCYTLHTAPSKMSRADAFFKTSSRYRKWKRSCRVACLLSLRFERCRPWHGFIMRR